MGITFLNASLLAGLLALTLPIVLHFWKRREPRTIDWAAMQFLPTSLRANRRRRFEEWVLLAVRLALLASLVFALAAPGANSSFWSYFADRPARETVLVLDASASMATAADSPWVRSKEAILRDLHQRLPNEKVAIVLARQNPTFCEPGWSNDFSRMERNLEALPTPRGNPGLGEALRIAFEKLRQDGASAEREIRVFTDGQRAEWLAETAEMSWRRFRRSVDQNKQGPRPNVRITAFAPSSTSNAFLGPLQLSRQVVPVGQTVVVRGEWGVHGPLSKSPQISWEFEGQHQTLPGTASDVRDPVPFEFAITPTRTGFLPVKVTLEADDALRSDNERFAVLEVVPEIPVLLIDGEPKVTSKSTTFFLRRALEDSEGVQWRSGFQIRVEPMARWIPKEHTERIWVFTDVGEWDDSQVKAVEAFLAAGGTVFVVMGPRWNADHANERMYRQGLGWLPAESVRIQNETDVLNRPTVDLASLRLASLEKAKDAFQASLGQARFSRWWRVQPDRDATVLARLTNGDAWLVSKSWEKGKVLVSTLPLDRSWDSPLPGIWEYPVLMNACLQELVGGGKNEWDHRAGEPLPLSASKVDRFAVTTPSGKAFRGSANDVGAAFQATHDVGLYGVAVSRDEAEVADHRWYVVAPTPAEASLQVLSEDERQKIAADFPLPLQWDAADMLPESLDVTSGELSGTFWLLMLLFLSIESGMMAWRAQPERGSR